MFIRITPFLQFADVFIVRPSMNTTFEYYPCPTNARQRMMEKISMLILSSSYNLNASFISYLEFTSIEPLWPCQRLTIRSLVYVQKKSCYMIVKEIYIYSIHLSSLIVRAFRIVIVHAIVYLSGRSLYQPPQDLP